MTDLLRATGLHKKFAGKQAVRDISLAVASREIVGLLGPNGAGKTTTFNMMIGQTRPTSGKVFLGDEEITQLPMYQRARRGLTYLPQEPSIFRKLTVEQNILAILERLPLSSRKRRQRLARLLGDLDLTEKAKQRAATLSGGERRRVEISRALVLDPRFLLLDEPFSGIDPIAVAGIQKIVSQLCGRGIGIVITDHNVRETLAICDRAYIIKDGRIIKEGAPGEIAQDPVVRESYLGEDFRL